MFDRTGRTNLRLGVIGSLLVSACTACPVLGQMGGMGRAPTIDFSDRKVEFNASDGVVIVADYFPVKVDEGKRTPAAILIHMYPADRKSWKPLIGRLRKAGIAALAYDIRGNGESTEPAEMNMAEGYKNPSGGHFSNAWMDVQGAHDWLRRQKNIDESRIVFVGASIGCSIALDYAGRSQLPKAVVCLSPGTDYFGVDSIQHIKKCANVPILLISPREEAEAVQALVEASEGKARSKTYPGGKEYHGTNMFQAEYGKKVRRRVIKFLKKELGVKDEAKKDKKKKKKKSKKKRNKKK